MLKFAAVSAIGGGNVQVVIRLTGCWMQEARVFMTMLDDATGAKAAELGTLVAQRSGLAVSTQRFSAIAADSSVESEATASSAATATAATTALRSTSAVTIKNDRSQVSVLLCSVTFHANLAHSLTRSP